MFIKRHFAFIGLQTSVYCLASTVMFVYLLSLSLFSALREQAVWGCWANTWHTSNLLLLLRQFQAFCTHIYSCTYCIFRFLILPIPGTFKSERNGTVEKFW